MTITTEDATAAPGIDTAEFELLRAEVAAYVGGPAEAWAERIERTGEVPEALWSELRERGYLSLAAPASTAGADCPSRSGWT